MKVLSQSPLFHNKLFINGEWVGTEKTIDVINPYSYEKIGGAPYATQEHVSKAIDCAKKQFDTFRFSSPNERATLLKAWAALIRQHRDELAYIITLEQGKPLSDSYGEIEYGLSFIDWFAEEARRIYGHLIQSDDFGEKLLVSLEPIGVVGAITPWNFPLAMITRKIAPALAVGCSVVIKPSEETPFIAYALADLAHQAGFPPGVINMVTGNPEEVGRIFCADSKMRKLSFTGSTRVGKILSLQAAEHLKKLSLELGGNAPMIVFESADIDEAIEGALYLKKRNSAQSCICGNRFMVQESIYEAFIFRFAQKYSKLETGSGFDNVDLGPLINTRARDHILSLIETSLKEGARLICGGELIEKSCIQPTVLADVTQAMRIANEEIFGPIAPFIKFQTEEEALQIANDTPYGLASYIYSQDYSQIIRVNERLKTGLVGINETRISKVQAPFGGVKESGIGREGSMYGIHDYLDIKYSCLRYQKRT